MRTTNSLSAETIVNIVEGSTSFDIRHHWKWVGLEHEICYIVTYPNGFTLQIGWADEWRRPWRVIPMKGDDVYGINYSSGRWDPYFYCTEEDILEVVKEVKAGNW